MLLDDNIISIDSDDDNQNYNAFNEYLTQDTERKKNSIALNFEEMGGIYLNEIDKKRKNNEIKKKKLIPYIIKNSYNQYDIDELNSYSFDDVKKIYDELKKENRSFIIKFFQFIFNLE